LPSVRLNLQDPGSPSGYLLETLAEVAPGADRGGGIFAWATSAGVRLLAEDAAVGAFLADAPFDLIVGVDAITDEAALDAIVAAQAKAHQLTARAFVHDLRPLLFHPKFTWFRREGELILIAGSGNLTVGGLRSNWELFTRAVATGAEANAIEATLREWEERWGEYLLLIDDPRVRERAAQNTGREELFQRPRVRRPREPREGVRTFSGSEPVLIAEIPRGDRWKQANFHREDYEGFFGAEVGSQRRILLQHVNADATIGDYENRPSVAVRSHNYRFELAAAGGLPYPDDGRPIGVYVRMGDGIFLYRLLMPGSDSYETIDAVLRERTDVPANRMRRLRLDARELREVWPDSPIWRAPRGE
jgi:hypothetical protein